VTEFRFTLILRYRVTGIRLKTGEDNMLPFRRSRVA